MNDKDVSKQLGQSLRELVAARVRQLRPSLIAIDDDGVEHEVTDEERAEMEREYARAKARWPFVRGYRDYATFAKEFGLSRTEVVRALAAGMPQERGESLLVVHRDEVRSWLESHRAEISDPPSAPKPAARARSKPTALADAIEAAPTMDDVEAALRDCLEQLREMDRAASTPLPATTMRLSHREPAFVEWRESPLVRQHYSR